MAPLRLIAEHVLFVISLLSLLIYSWFFSFNFILTALLSLLLLIGLFFRSRILAFLCMILYALLLAFSPLAFSAASLLLFSFLHLLPFFICFKIISSTQKGELPSDSLSILLLPILLAFLYYTNWGLASSLEFFSPRSILLISLLLLLTLILLISLLQKLWQMATWQPEARRGDKV